MKQGIFEKIYGTILLVVLGGIIIHAPLSVGLGTTFPGFELLIKSWKEILMIALVPIVAWFVWKNQLLKELARDRIIQIAILYIFLHIITASAVLTGLLATFAGLAIDLRFILFFVLVYIFLKYKPEYRDYCLKVGAAGAAIVVGFGILQLFLPPDFLTIIGYGEDTIQPYLTVDKNPDFIRINSTLRGPNPLGAYIVILLGLITSAIFNKKIDIRQPKMALIIGGATLMSLIVLWVSYSRSAVGAAGVTIFIVTVTAARRLISRNMWIAGCIILFALLGGIVAGRDHPFIEHVVLHQNEEGGSEISSNDDHVHSLIDGTKRMLRQPIGAGIGSTGSASLMTDNPLIIENQYLFIAHEVGWLGLVLFLVLIGLVLDRLWQQRKDWLSLGLFASGIGLSLIGILLPVWVDDTVSIIWWGFAAVAIATGGRYANRKTKQKTKRSS